MCGINGIYNFNQEPVRRRELEVMNRKMIHRGPDDEGYYTNGSLGFSMRRLSIIDLEKGRQPVFSEDNSVVVIMNGEIYNYLELREKLIKKGHLFRSNSDTEVIVHLYEEKGADFVDDLNGMFAIAIYDTNNREVYLFRDRIGIKPLFYTGNSSSFIFSSNLTSITSIYPSLREINFNSFLSYMSMSYTSYPESIFKDVYKLEPGHYLTISSNGKIKKKNYWSIHDFGSLYFPKVEDYQEMIRSLLRDAIRLQMRSDVPIGTFLSGGIDSSCVVAFLSEQVEKPIRTYSVGFQGGPNELVHAGMVAEKFNTDHTEVFISENEIPDLLPDIIDKMDEPVSDSAIVPTYVLSKIASNKGVKVILNGTGGDEIFGGYYRYIPQNIKWRIINSWPEAIRKLSGCLIKQIDFDKGERIAKQELSFIASISGINYFLANKLFKNKSHYDAMVDDIISQFGHLIFDNSGKPQISQLMHLDLKNYLVNDVLSLLDKMTMALSIEGRVPLLDHRIVETCFKIPENILLKDRRLKWLLKSSLSGILPQALFNLPKAGFAGPVFYWANNSLKNHFYEHLVIQPIPLFKEYFNPFIIKEILNKKIIHWRYSYLLFSLFIFSLWYKKHVMELDLDI